MLLSRAPCGETVRITALYLPRPFRARLSALGFLPGEALFVRRRRKSALVCCLRGVDYAIGTALADGIFVVRSKGDG